MRITGAGIAAGVAVLLIAALCVRLGFWQLDRLEQRRALNASASAALTLPPVQLDSTTLTAIRARPEAFVNRRAVALGRYASAGAILLRGRAHQGRPGVHLVVPLKLEESAATLLVNRGWLPSPDAATADPRAHVASGSQHVAGVLQVVPDVGAEALAAEIQLQDTSVATYRRLDLATMTGRVDASLLPVYLELTEPGAAALPAPVPLPTFDEGSHLSYAVQWFSFAVIAVVGFLILALRRAHGPSPRRSP